MYGGVDPKLLCMVRMLYPDIDKYLEFLNDPVARDLCMLLHGIRTLDELYRYIETVLELLLHPRIVTKFAGKNLNDRPSDDELPYIGYFYVPVTEHLVLGISSIVKKGVCQIFSRIRSDDKSLFLYLRTRVVSTQEDASRLGDLLIPVDGSVPLISLEWDIMEELHEALEFTREIKLDVVAVSSFNGLHCLIEKKCVESVMKLEEKGIYITASRIEGSELELLLQYVDKIRLVLGDVNVLGVVSESFVQVAVPKLGIGFKIEKTEKTKRLTNIVMFPSSDTLTRPVPLTVIQKNPPFTLLTETVAPTELYIPHEYTKPYFDLNKWKNKLAENSKEITKLVKKMTSSKKKLEAVEETINIIYELE